MMWHDWNNGWSTESWVLMGFMMVVLWTLVGVGIWLARGRNGRHDAPPTGSSTARRILDERLAGGQLTEQEYRERRELLDSP
jgi:putative membrane protein